MTSRGVFAGEVTLGRGSDCDFVIQARSLSRRHATLLMEGGTHFIQDLDSRNKTYRGTVSQSYDKISTCIPVTNFMKI